MRKVPSNDAVTVNSKLRIETNVDYYNPMKAVREEVARKKQERLERLEKAQKLLGKKKYRSNTR